MPDQELGQLARTNIKMTYHLLAHSNGNDCVDTVDRNLGRYILERKMTSIPKSWRLHTTSEGKTPRTIELGPAPAMPAFQRLDYGFSFQLFYPAAGLPQLLPTPTAAVALTDLKWGVLRIPSSAPLSACLHYTHRGESAGSKQQAAAAHSWRQVLWGIIIIYADSTSGE